MRAQTTMLSSLHKLQVTNPQAFMNASLARWRGKTDQSQGFANPVKAAIKSVASIQPVVM
jgi:hypothetical protein